MCTILIPECVCPIRKELSQKQIGQRITELRKRKGLSQEDLAKKVKISRPSLAQIELGNRGVNVLELQSLSLVLGFSLDDFTEYLRILNLNRLDSYYNCLTHEGFNPNRALINAWLTQIQQNSPIFVNKLQASLR